MVEVATTGDQGRSARWESARGCGATQRCGKARAPSDVQAGGLRQ